MFRMKIFFTKKSAVLLEWYYKTKLYQSEKSLEKGIKHWNKHVNTSGIVVRGRLEIDRFDGEKYLAHSTVVLLKDK